MYVLYMCLSANACIPQQKMWRSEVKLRCYPPCFDQGDSLWYITTNSKPAAPQASGNSISISSISLPKLWATGTHCVHMFQIPSQVLMLAWQALNSLGCLLSQKTVLYLQFLFFKTLALSTRRFGLFFLVDIKYLFIFISIINFTNSIHAYDVYQSNQGEQHFYFPCENFSYLNFKDTNDIICKHIS